MGEAKRRGAAQSELRRLYAPSHLEPITRFALPAGGPRELAAETRTLAESVRARVRAALVRGSAERSLARMEAALEALAAECAEGFEHALADAAARDPARARELAAVACRRGCAFCCYVDVLVTPLEAIRLARRAPTETLAPARGRAPCPLLGDGACSAYAERPYACRAVFSPDARRCEEGFTTDGTVFVPSLDWPRDIAAGYISGELAALRDVKLQSRMVVLRGALGALGGDRGALLRWLNGEEIF